MSIHAARYSKNIYTIGGGPNDYRTVDAIFMQKEGDPRGIEITHEGQVVALKQPGITIQADEAISAYHMAHVGIDRDSQEYIEGFLQFKATVVASINAANYIPIAVSEDVYQRVRAVWERVGKPTCIIKNDPEIVMLFMEIQFGAFRI